MGGEFAGGLRLKEPQIRFQLEHPQNFTQFKITCRGCPTCNRNYVICGASRLLTFRSYARFSECCALKVVVHFWAKEKEKTVN